MNSEVRQWEERENLQAGGEDQAGPGRGWGLQPTNQQRSMDGQHMAWDDGLYTHQPCPGQAEQRSAGSPGNTVGFQCSRGTVAFLCLLQWLFWFSTHAGASQLPERDSTLFILAPRFLFEGYCVVSLCAGWPRGAIFCCAPSFTCPSDRVFEPALEDKWDGSLLIRLG